MRHAADFDVTESFVFGQQSLHFALHTTQAFFSVNDIPLLISQTVWSEANAAALQSRESQQR